MTVSYRAYAEDASVASSPFTIPGLDIGSASISRVVAVGISLFYGSDPGTDGKPTAVAIGGVPAAEAVGASDATLLHITHSIWSAQVPTGTTGDVVVTVGGGADLSAGVLCAIGVWALDGVSPTASDGASDFGLDDTCSLAVDVANGSAVVAAVFSVGGSVGAVWTGLTEDFDRDAFAAGNVTQTGSSLSATGAETPRSVSCSFAGSGGIYNIGVAAVWPPEVAGGVTMSAEVGAYALTGADVSLILTAPEDRTAALRPLFRRIGNTFWRGRSSI